MLSALCETKLSYLRVPFPMPLDDPTPLRLETLLPTERAAPLPPPLWFPLRSIVLTTRSMSSVVRSRQLARSGSISDTCCHDNRAGNRW